VNAQNEQDLEKIWLTSSITATEHFEVNSKAALTTLHEACFNGHLTIVKYLIEYQANYFIKNQTGETSIMNGESHE
jgi:ankyrin repeat protein